MESRGDKPIPGGKEFAADPFGYSATAWHRWGLLQELAGFEVALGDGPARGDLLSPVLWLAHARALTAAATTLIRSDPSFDPMPGHLQGICDAQYRAVGLMLVGYSLEVAMKAMLIIRLGVETYTADEQQYRHHRLEDLAEIVPGIGEKDRAILRNLSRFTLWAGRYPDPGMGKEVRLNEIFDEAEKNQITAFEVFDLAGRVMAHSQIVVKDL